MDSAIPPVGPDPASARHWIGNVMGGAVDGASEEVQSLWSGYGRIERFTVTLPNGTSRSVILKAVVPPRGPVDHPRGFGTNLSHQRKLKSYEIEHTFYRDFSEQLNGFEIARVPQLLGQAQSEVGSLLLLEDLDAAGLDGRRQHLDPAEVARCLGWLAEFHGRFMGTVPTGLWARGTYWHLATRPDEWEAIDNESVRCAAHAIDAQLSAAQYATLVHGDAKLANFCFGADRVAAVDFQYVGGGVGVQDVAYFLGSCLDDAALEERAEGYLDQYFETLLLALERFHPDMDGGAIEKEWRALWPTSWADFHRFLLGWSPGHWKLSRYSETMLEVALGSL